MVDRIQFTESAQREPSAPGLVRYRVVGGPAGVDQRLTIFEDGLVKLEELHRSRGPLWLAIGSHDLEDLRAALERIPRGRWSRRPALMLKRASVALHYAFSWQEDLGHSFFQVKRGRRTIVGDAGDETDMKAVMVLDGMRYDAVSRAEELHPTC